ncbi:hypothetical protein GGR57DRAFT_475809 [Xylariaceae sp. FL1272]|nr:hypothetical protein GGR57DRAFT_475809 [Xylariaceae sp. FL1272]
MAEILGIVASSIAVAEVAVKAGSAMFKLKDLWESVKNVPETIADLMDQIDCLDPTLWDAEYQFSQNQLPPELWNDVTAVRSLAACRKAREKLSNIANELSRLIQSKRRVDRAKGRVKVILSKNELLSIEKRLSTAVSMLQSAQMGYLMTLARAQPDIIAEKLISSLKTDHNTKNIFQASIPTSTSAEHSPIEVGNDHEDERHRDPSEPRTTLTKLYHSSTTTLNSLEGMHIGPSEGTSIWGYFKARKMPAGCTVEFKPPSWLTGATRVWLLYYTHQSYAGWTYQIRAYNMRPWTSQIFLAARRNDIPQLQALFQSGVASPFDRDQNGDTVLHYAARTLAVETYCFLESMNLELDGVNIWGETPLDFLGIFPDHDQSIATQHQRISTILSCTTGIRALILDDKELRLICRCPLVSDWLLFQSLQPDLCPAHSKTSLQSRLETVYWTILRRFPVELEQIKFILGEEWTERTSSAYDSFSASPYDLINILAVVASQLAGINSGDAVDLVDFWRSFIREAVQRTAELHPLYWCELELGGWDDHYFVGSFYEFQGLFSPLLVCMIIHHPRRFRTRWQADRYRIQALQQWLAILDGAGVDLVQYGHRENELLRDTEFTMAREVKRIYLFKKGWGVDDSWVGESYLYGYKIGVVPSEGECFWSEPTDEFAGQFWDMVEDPTQDMPGAWCD